MGGYLKIVVCGEVDSGKSTLIGRFIYEMDSLSNGIMQELKDVCRRLDSDFEFAYILDSLEEERKNKLTIDTTQIFCRNKGNQGFLFIDVPGHRQLIKNMLCGSSYADIAVIVIDVSKTIEDGTKRHLHILKFLGIEDIIFVLNKMDLVDYREEIFLETKKKMEDFLEGIDIKAKNFIPASAKHGENLKNKSKIMVWYKGASLVKTLNDSFAGAQRKECQDLYFPVQDIYHIENKDFLVGTVISGRITKNETVKIAPLNKKAKVKTIMLFNKTVPYAKAKESIGVRLEDSFKFQRGQIIYKVRSPELTDSFCARIFCVLPFAVSERLVFKCSTQQSYARIVRFTPIFRDDSLKLDDRNNWLHETEAIEVFIILEEKVLIKKDRTLNSLGRFILQNESRQICAAGVITE
jgi:small GTP-binding protein